MLGQVAGEVKFEASCVLGSDRLAMNVDCTYLLGDPGKWFPHSFFICNVGIVNPPPPRQVTAVYTTGDPSTDGAHWRQQHLEAQKAPGGSGWGKALPDPALLLPSQSLSHLAPGASRRRSEFHKSQEKNYLARASPGRDQLPIGVGGVLSLSGDSCYEGPLIGLLFWLARISPEMGLRDGLWV